MYLLIVIAISRFAAVVVSSVVLYFLQGRVLDLDKRSLYMIWYSGLIRGTIAVALALQISSNNAVVLVTTTLIIALTTTLVFSNLISRFARYIKLESNVLQGYFDLVPSLENRDQSYCYKVWNKIDSQYLEPWFGKDVQQENNNSWKKVWEEDGVSLNELETK